MKRADLTKLEFEAELQSLGVSFIDVSPCDREARFEYKGQRFSVTRPSSAKLKQPWRRALRLVRSGMSQIDGAE
jgi:hypothetical protein